MSKIQLNKRLIYVTGLPRAGSTFLCQLLGHHPNISSTGHSSPLCPTLNKLRHQLSDNEFLLSQLDVDFDIVYQRLLNAFRGFINGWFAESESVWVVDKSRGWLNQLEMVHHLDPDCRMLVCVRDLGQIYGSIETQHQKTLLLDFPDHLAILSRYARADNLFGNEGVIGAPLKTIENLQDIDSGLQSRLYYVIFEHLMKEPVTVMREIYKWLNLPDAPFDPQQLKVKAHESDSYYRFKYRHKTHSKIRPPDRHSIPPRIEVELKKNFFWFYQTFYPKV
jgi:sulfotransferase